MSKKKKQSKSSSKKIINCEVYQDSLKQHQKMLIRNRYFLQKVHNEIMYKHVKLIKKFSKIHHQFIQNRNMYEVQKMLNLIKAANK